MPSNNSANGPMNEVSRLIGESMRSLNVSQPALGGVVEKQQQIIAILIGLLRDVSAGQIAVQDQQALVLQRQLDQMNQSFTMMSNILKAQQRTTQSAINNLR